MNRSIVQYQKWLSLNEFLRHLGTEEPYHTAVFRWRWSLGFKVLHCEHDQGCLPNTPKLIQEMLERDSGKTKFVAAVLTTADGHLKYIKITAVKVIRKRDITARMKSRFREGSYVISDGVSDAGIRRDHVVDDRRGTVD